ncbi:unnamed protein product [Penicillium salamii]|uniref:NmrA-like domain-containing protein n=1 Tax=Penicillium salamii TaxID=1612424 RepID=A0A9W4NPR5_9EURO|nr:unnamed protein product [Penicillium salamii]CAG8257570.1 unnamed protein product [Penicillium salamii]CAG8375205.1 unnamed protein product [Penicillium salamii]CAG8399297.1 unnamed protein product [Penicillium salamii]CAG8405538.1 unnamed protein product [Penicillium salamii]
MSWIYVYHRLPFGPNKPIDISFRSTKMVKVAIAGGTGDVGRTIVEIIKDNPRHEAVILTRKPNGDIFGVPSLVVDYTNVNSLREILEEHNIHTVICAIGYEGDAPGVSQLNLIKAAEASVATIRFVPSAFACVYTPEMAETFPPLRGYIRAIEELRKSHLEWTSFLNGYFMDYFAPGKIKSYLRPFPTVIDIEHRVAAIPGNGDVPITFTYSFDVARFVVSSLDLEEWPDESRMAGDVLTWNELVSLAEEILGSEFEVHHDDIEKLKRSEVTELPVHSIVYKQMPKSEAQAMSAAFSLWAQDANIMHIPGELNTRFPDIHPLTIRGLVEKYRQ